MVKLDSIWYKQTSVVISSSLCRKRSRRQLS